MTAPTRTDTGMAQPAPDSKTLTEDNIAALSRALVMRAVGGKKNPGTIDRAGAEQYAAKMGKRLGVDQLGQIAARLATVVAYSTAALEATDDTADGPADAADTIDMLFDLAGREDAAEAIDAAGQTG